MHNNPHYHVLFFLENANDERYSYVKIAPKDFRHLVRRYWQGFDEDTDGAHPYTNCVYGIAREGENCGKVTDFRACCYVAKYVCKDVKLVKHESEVEKKVKFKLKIDARKNEDAYKQFLHEVLYPLYNTPLNAKRTVWLMSDIDLLKSLVPEKYQELFPDSVDYRNDVSSVCYKYHLWDEFEKFIDKFIEEDLKKAICEWRNRFSNKCRISQGVGDYALEFIGDKLNPTFKVPDKKKGFKNRPMSMYYYRKLFTDVVKPTEETALGKVREYPAIRVLNEDGIKYKLAHLSARVSKMASKARNNLSLLLDNAELFEKMKQSDINTEVWCSHSEFLRMLARIEDNINIFERYAEYKLVYEDRFFKIPDFGSDDVFDFPIIDPRGDYERFLVPSVYSVSRSDLRLDMFLEGDTKDYLPYSQHPYFLRYLGIFHILDMCSDYWFIQGDDKAQREAEEIAKTKRFHSERKLKDFYSQFNVA